MPIPHLDFIFHTHTIKRKGHHLAAQEYTLTTLLGNRENIIKVFGTKILIIQKKFITLN